MKVGIISINLHTRRLNYGAVLHTWAFQQLMLRRGDMDGCEVIDYLPDGRDQGSPWTYFIRKKKGNPVKLIKWKNMNIIGQTARSKVKDRADSAAVPTKTEAPKTDTSAVAPKAKQ